MEPRHISSSSSNHVHDTHGQQSLRRSDGRSTGTHHSGPSPMAIQVPRRTILEAPPPLPPPRYVNDSSPCHGSGGPYAHASGGGFPDESKGSARAGLSFPKSWGARMDAERTQERPECNSREASTRSSLSTLRSPTDSERRYEASRHPDEGYYSLSGPSAMNQQSVWTFSSYKSAVFLSVLQESIPCDEEAVSASSD